MLFQNHRINVLDKVWSRSLKLRKLSINCLLELSKNLKIKRGESLLASTGDKTDPLLTVHCWKNEEIFNPIQDGLFRGPKKLHPSVKSVTLILQWWNLAQIYLAQRRSKNIWITWHTSWVLLTPAFFHWKSANLAISRNTDIDCILIHNFYLF